MTQRAMLLLVPPVVGYVSVLPVLFGRAAPLLLLGLSWGSALVMWSLIGFDSRRVSRWRLARRLGRGRPETLSPVLLALVLLRAGGDTRDGLRRVFAPGGPPPLQCMPAVERATWGVARELPEVLPQLVASNLGLSADDLVASLDRAADGIRWFETVSALVRVQRLSGVERVLAELAIEVAVRDGVPLDDVELDQVLALSGAQAEAFERLAPVWSGDLQGLLSAALLV